MTRIFYAAWLCLGLVVGACATSEAPTGDEPDGPDNGALVGAPDPDDGAPVDEIPSALATRVYPPGCSAPVVCAGAKTCTPYTALTPCSAPTTVCCARAGRAGICSESGEALPLNRSRTCTMRATGATCIEIQYLEQTTCQSEPVPGP